MTRQHDTFQSRSLVQQGYDYSPAALRELEWGLRFTPIVCMLLAVGGLLTQTSAIHFALAVLGMGFFWLPAWHPFDLLYNHALRPLWNGVKLPPNPLPRRIACFMGGGMNLGIALAFAFGGVALAYGFGAVLIVLQLVVITTHFCLASWMYEGALKAVGRWTAPVAVDAAKRLIESDGQLIDVRNPDEYARGHLPGARNVPLERVSRELGSSPDLCYVVYCASGLRAQQAAQILKRNGAANVHNLGSMSRWR